MKIQSQKRSGDLLNIQIGISGKNGQIDHLIPV